MKKALVIILVIVLIVLLIPIPYRVKDGGSICWAPILPMYEVWVYRTMPNPIYNGSLRGYAVYLFGIEVIDETYIEPCDLENETNGTSD